MEELKYELQKLSAKEQSEVRKKIVREMEKRGGETKEVAEICECTVRHVQKTWKKYREGGVKAIAAAKMGRPVGVYCKLTKEQEEEIKQEITEKNPSEAGLSGYLWSRGLVRELAKAKYGIEMSARTMGNYLAKWNIRPQRPKKKIIDKSHQT
ncbi:MAG: winged helix-turn-helix domain-containing protein [Oscillospiraceae bacterium]|nr:winged helix-turn-helix domain-containing protein [Oscillospiraceae bacterium]